MAISECNDLTSECMKIHAVSEALIKGWDYLDPDRKAETLGRLKKRIDNLIGGSIDAPRKKANVEKAEIVLHKLEDLEKFNSTVNSIYNHPEHETLIPAVVDMAVESILDCGCREAGVLVERDKI